jgi:hypothetical protein
MPITAGTVARAAVAICTVSETARKGEDVRVWGATLTAFPLAIKKPTASRLVIACGAARATVGVLVCRALLVVPTGLLVLEKWLRPTGCSAV